MILDASRCNTYHQVYRRFSGVTLKKGVDVPSAKKVVAVRMSDEQYAALTHFATVMGQSRASLLLEMLDQMSPVWDKLGRAIEAARIAEKGAKNGWREGVLCQLDDMELKADGLKDEALQLVVNSLGHFEEAVRTAGGARSDTADGRTGRTKPPYL